MNAGDGFTITSDMYAANRPAGRLHRGAVSNTVQLHFASQVVASPPQQMVKWKLQLKSCKVGSADWHFGHVQDQIHLDFEGSKLSRNSASPQRGRLASAAKTMANSCTTGN